MQTLKQYTYGLTRISLTMVALAALNTGTAHALEECFLQIDGVDGGSSQRYHEHAIEVTAYSWEEKNLAQASSSGAVVGHVQMDYLHVSMPPGKAGPVLMLLVANGGNSRQAVLECIGTNARGNAPGREAPTYRWVLSEVTINSFQSGWAVGQNNSAPLDQVTLGFGKISLEYVPAAIKVEWDSRRNAGGFVSGGAVGQQATTPPQGAASNQQSTSRQGPPKTH